MRNHKYSKTNSLQGLGPQTPLVKPHSAVCKAHTPNISHKNEEPPGPHNGHNDEKIALVLALPSGFAIWNMF